MAETAEILVTGGTGQIGRELLARAWPAHVRVHAPGRDELDLCDGASIERLFAAHRYAAVINCAAYTAVDRAEDDVAAAFAANALGPARLADATRRADIPLVQVSTDYVFDGRAAHAYGEDDPTGPLNVYGASKLTGELAVRSGNPRHVVLRTSWVLSVHGSNFLKTMLRLAETGTEVRVVADQIGAPTAASDLAAALAEITLRLMQDGEARTGIYHLSGAGLTNWAELAGEIFRVSAEIGSPAARVVPIRTSEFPAPAQRPMNSALDTAKIGRDYGIEARPWQAMIGDLVRHLNGGARA